MNDLAIIRQNKALKITVGVLSFLLILSGLYVNYLNIKKYYDKQT
jgi:hypothetical protein